MWYIASQPSLYPELFLARIPSLELLTLSFQCQRALDEASLKFGGMTILSGLKIISINDCEIFSEKPELFPNRISLPYMSRPSVYDVLSNFLILSSLEVVFFICFVCSSDIEIFDVTK